ncbi:hypothetical protein [Mycoplasma seminis]|uniref:Uncharacterized protein n=1 Tax=Mycoplasma seminis TaxID=512749 RepID=A0ABY9HB46_9MOLU|nr:hypothetical protein [Mycoplasma seminis]WLP85789.1 hypothetical protein Q8852_01425 [Mycoplasma seminis]
MREKISNNFKRTKLIEFYAEILDCSVEWLSKSRNSDSYLLNKFKEQYADNIRNVAYKIFNIKRCSSIRVEDIKNLLLAELAKLMSGQNPKYESDMLAMLEEHNMKGCFSYFWTCLKNNVSNAVGKVCNKQEEFEVRLNGNEIDLGILKYQMNASEIKAITDAKKRDLTIQRARAKAYKKLKEQNYTLFSQNFQYKIELPILEEKKKIRNKMYKIFVEEFIERFRKIQKKYAKKKAKRPNSKSKKVKENKN